MDKYIYTEHSATFKIAADNKVTRLDISKLY